MEQIFEVHFYSYNQEHERIVCLESDLGVCRQFTAGHIITRDFKEYNPQSQVVLNRPNLWGHYLTKTPRSPKFILQCIRDDYSLTFLTHDINHINKFWNKIKQLQFIDEL